MRLLLSNHAPPQQSPPGRLMWYWAKALQAAGNEVRLFVADDQHRFGEELPTERVVCGSDPNADLLFGLPRFRDESAATSRPTFIDLTDAQLARYRDCLRRRLDNQIANYNPHVIHLQHIWILGQLALESGVPYVLNAWEAELGDEGRDERYRPIVEQAAENASRILVTDDAMKQRVVSRFEIPAERVVVKAFPSQSADEASPSDLAADGAFLQQIYQALLAERFG